MEEWRSEESQNSVDIDDDLFESIKEFSVKFNIDPTCLNLKPSFLDVLINETKETIQKQVQVDANASPLSEVVTGLQECNEELKKPNASVKEKIAGFLEVLSKWAKQIYASVEGEKYLTKIVDLFKGIANNVQHHFSRFFGKKQTVDLEEDVVNTSDNTVFQNGN